MAKFVLPSSTSQPRMGNAGDGGSEASLGVASGAGDSSGKDHVADGRVSKTKVDSTKGKKKVSFAAESE